MKIVRDYLTSAEINYIVDAILQKDTAFEREIVKVALVAQLVAEDIGDFTDCNDIYDKVVADSTINFSAIINNYDIIDKIVAEETGVNKILKEFVDGINENLKGVTENMDLNGAIQQLKEISESGDVVNGKHKVQQPRGNKKVSK